MITLKSKINVDKRGKISTGIKAISERTQKEYPKATDYFVVTDFPELIRSYGEKPTKLVLFFPDNEIEAFFSADNVLYGGNQTLIRKCDGSECLHRIDEEVAGKKYVAGEVSECVCAHLPEDDKKRCKVASYIKAYIADAKTGKIDNPLCYLFYTGSQNSAENIYSELKKIRNLLGGNLVGIPFGLSVEMVSGRTDAKQKFPIWSLQVLGTVSQLKIAMESYLFDYKEILKIDTGNNSPQLEEHKPEEKTLDPVREKDWSLNEKEQQEIIERQNPEYWIGAINSQKSYTELTNFEKEFHLELTMFGGEDEQILKKAIEAKRRQLLK